MPDFRVMVDGGYPDFAPGSAGYKRMQTNIDLHGDRMIRYGTQYGVPPAYLLAIMCIESVPAGNANSCSPCSVCGTLCDKYPGPCCAYGLMQFTQGAAIECNVPGGAMALMGNPDLAVEMACCYILNRANKAPWKYGMDIVKISAAYNAGSWKCRQIPTGNWFGNVEDIINGVPSDYAEKAVRWTNTAIKLGFGVGAMPGGAGPSAATLAGLALLAGAGAALWYFTRRR